jgi:hypothetical protein
MNCTLYSRVEGGKEPKSMIRNKKRKMKYRGTMASGLEEVGGGDGSIRSEEKEEG